MNSYLIKNKLISKKKKFKKTQQIQFDKCIYYIKRNKFEDITMGMQLDYKQQNEKLKHFYLMLGVVKRETNKATIYIENWYFG